MTYEQALALLMRYNKEPFHIQHALTVGEALAYFAGQAGENVDFWRVCGLLHDIDFELYPQEHCQKVVDIFAQEGICDEALLHAIRSHGYGLCSDVAPESYMEKILFAVDELTGLIGAAARMRPSKSTKDMELSSLKKKYKDKKFAAGCSRDVIAQGAENLGWSLDDLLQKTILAMREGEDAINEKMQELGL